MSRCRRRRQSIRPMSLVNVPYSEYANSGKVCWIAHRASELRLLSLRALYDLQMSSPMLFQLKPDVIVLGAQIIRFSLQFFEFQGLIFLMCSTQHATV